MINNVILLVIGVLALSILIYKTIKNFKSKTPGCCSDCSNCKLSKK